jgi:hypothetical protein
MVQDRFLSKEERGSNTIYTITNRARRAWELGVLGADENDNRRKLRSLCQFLILSHHLHQGRLISEIKLDDILNRLGSTRSKLKVESRVQADGSNFCEVIYCPVSPVMLRMIELVDTNYGADKLRRYYYYKEEGFSIEQVLNLLNGIREYPLFVGDFQYDVACIEKAIKRLLEEGYIVAGLSYYNQQSWYHVPNQLDNSNSYQTVLDQLWYIRSIESSYLSMEATIRKLTENEKVALRALFGNIGSYRIFKDAKSSLKLNKKLRSSEEQRTLLESINELIDRKIEQFKKAYKDILRDNYLLSDTLDKIVIRNSVSKNIAAA